jgi:hypothetical protein
MHRAFRTYGKRKDTYRILVGKPERRRPFGRLRRRYEDNIKINLRQVECGYGLDQSGS